MLGVNVFEERTQCDEGAVDVFFLGQGGIEGGDARKHGLENRQRLVGGGGTTLVLRLASSSYLGLCHDDNAVLCWCVMGMGETGLMMMGGNFEERRRSHGRRAMPPPVPCSWLHCLCLDKLSISWASPKSKHVAFSHPPTLPARTLLGHSAGWACRCRTAHTQGTHVQEVAVSPRSDSRHEFSLHLLRTTKVYTRTRDSVTFPC